MSTAANFHTRMWSGTNYGSFSTKYLDIVPVRNYLSTSPFTLNSIYTLTREAAVTNSLLLDFTVNLATSSVYYL
jgi:hypothetical protein